MTNFYFLGAGRPHSGDVHTALRAINNSSKVIDWNLNAISFLKPICHFVCGYQAEDIINLHPNLIYIENKEWETTKAGWSFLTALSNMHENALVSYSDIVFRESTIEKIIESNGDITITVDSHWRSRYAGRAFEDLDKCEKVCLSQSKVKLLGSQVDSDLANAEFIGLVNFSKKAIEELKKIKSEFSLDNATLKQANLSDLVELFRVRGLKVNAIDVYGDWAQLNEAQDLAKFILGTKAQTLSNLKKMIRLSRIEDQVSFTVNAWKNKSSLLIDDIQNSLGEKSLIVRSSALSEDSFLSSSAGMYSSILNVNGTRVNEIRNAVDSVIDSYPDNNLENEVLIQPMLSNVLISGVIFTRSLQDGAPYYTINYDDTSGSTESITSGTSKDDKTVIVRRNTDHRNKALPKNLMACCKLSGKLKTC